MLVLYQVNAGINLRVLYVRKRVEVRYGIDFLFKKPILFCLKRIGPREVNFMPIAINIINGRNNTIPIKDPIISIIRLRII